MRIVLWIVLALGVLWGGYWFVGSATLDREVNAWFDAQSTGDRVVGREAVSVAGFPNRFDVTVTAPYVMDAATGWGWKAPFLQLFSMTWKPWHWIAVTAPTQEITSPSGRIITVTSDIRASLQLYPGLNLSLNEARVDVKKLTFTADDWSMAAGEVEFAAAADPSWPSVSRPNQDREPSSASARMGSCVRAGCAPGQVRTQRACQATLDFGFAAFSIFSNSPSSLSQSTGLGR